MTLTNQRASRDFVVATAAAVAAAADQAIGDALQLDQDYTRLLVEVVNGGDEALDQFDLEGKVHPDSAWANIVTDWSSVAGFLLYKTATINTLGAGLTGAAVVDITGWHSIRFVGSANTTPGVVTVRGRLA